MKAIRRVDTPFGRVYAHGKGIDAILMPSVTTILAAEPSLYLNDLEKKIGKEELDKLGRRGAARGSAMHKFLENYFICMKHGGSEDKCLLYTQKKTPPELLEEGLEEERIVYGRNLFYNFLSEGVFDQIKRVLYTEKFVWSLTHLFAGTSDFVFENLELEDVISDFKSASGNRGDEVINKYKKQTGAYAIAYEEIHGRIVKNTQIWISSPEGMQLAKVEGDELLHYKNEFIKSAKEFHKNWNYEPIKNYYIENYVK